MAVKPPQRGFTIVETLIALSILLVGFLATSMLHVAAARGNTVARNRTIATILAYEHIERLQRLSFENIVSGTDAPALNGRQFSRTWTITGAGANSKTVAVTVSWTDQWGTASVTIPGVVRR